MVDVDRERGTFERFRLGPDPALVCAVERDEHPLAPVVRELPLQLVERHERVLAGKRRLAVQVHDHVLAQLLERKLRRQERPEGVAVGVLVGDE